MKSKAPLLASLALAITLSASAKLFAQDDKKTDKAPGTAANPKQNAPPAGSEQPKLTQEQLEAKFKATLTQATLKGRWCGIQDGKLTPEKEDKYTINNVTKLGGDAWIISARIQYGQKDFVAPVPVQVKWAGDTPVITLDNVGLPGGHSYSARVLIYDQAYAGTWSGGDHAGLLDGIITHQPEKTE